MIKMIRPIVNTAKIIEDFDAVIVGFSGVLSDGAVIRKEAVDALINMKKNGKKIVLCSNTVLRVSQLCDLFVENKVPLKLFDAIITAGEILHYKLKNRSGDLEHIGQKYYRLGSGKNTAVFANLDYQAVNSLPEADFMFMDSVAAEDDTIDRYMPLLEQAAGMGIPFVIAGNDTSSFKDGKICLAPGALAEQYAVLGGRIITVGKPDPLIMAYCMEVLPIETPKERILVIGDNLATDIKGANLAGFGSLLVTKGVHVNFLGEGYISDVAKTRELASNLDGYPDYIISNLRW